ncbi:hypothetical protein GIB67_038632 [Kingdonia uniflora]|uniref:Uncharacterized protein n=1 Tax=Kingdonia uniflora TaxID=39325 RepID=A0A7J7NPM0_9MAGN|nr:hypothetical protein GIB67_038632 [Kingdonia uniflora]
MERWQKNMLNNEESCNNGNVVLSKRYKAYDMESEKDASVLESRMVRVGKGEKNEEDNSKDVLQFYGVKNFKASGGSHFCASVTRRCFFDLNSGGQTWNDNIIWVKGVKSAVERKESLLDEVVEEETELKLVLGELGLSRKKKVKSRSRKVVKAQSTRSMTSVDGGKRQLSIDEIKKALPASGTTVSGEVIQGKRRWVEPLGNSGEKVVEGQLQVEAKANLDETVEERDILGRHLMLKGYSQEEVDAIKADTYAEEEEEEAEVLVVADGLDGVSPQTILDNQGDDVELPEGGSEKAVREMSLRINDQESGLSRERETSKSLLSVRAELQVELDASRAREGYALMCNWEFVKQFDRMKEANENRDDQYVKACFRLEKLNQTVSDQTLQVEEKDSGIKKGLEDLSETTEHAENL